MKQFCFAPVFLSVVVVFVANFVDEPAGFHLF